jgi:hypothetical protein
MYQTLAIALTITVALFIGYLVMRAYFPKRGRAGAAAAATEPFQATPPPPRPTKVALTAVPAPAPPQLQDPAMEPRVIAPGGPAAPAAAPPATTKPSISPDARPVDPYDDPNMEAPVHDSLRYPELSFGPGVDNTATTQIPLSGIGSATAVVANSNFSPEFAQNGASFMGNVTANDLQPGDLYGTA